MRRLVPVVLLILLAGCWGYPGETGLHAGVETVAVSSNGSYDITATITSGHGAAFSDVTLTGYSMNGTSVCRAGFGTVSGSDSESMRCSQLPAILVPTAAETDLSDLEGDWSGIRHNLSVYVGYRNGSHEYRSFHDWEVDDAERSSPEVQPPGERLRRTAKCFQWSRGHNLSALRSPPWMDWESKTPNVSRSFEYSIDNNTENAGRYDVYSADRVNPAVDSMIERAQEASHDDFRSYPIDRTTYLEAVDALSEGSVDSLRDVRSNLDSVRGRVRSWNWSRSSVDCHVWPPEYTGSSGVSMRVHVQDDNSVWRIHLSTELRRSGQALTDSSLPDSSSSP